MMQQECSKKTAVSGSRAADAEKAASSSASPVVIGLTGTIASGKSTVSDIFRELGFPVVDADRIAAELLSPGTSVLEQIAKTFGDEMILPDGRYDRRRMGALVSADPKAREALNGIVHPAIREAVKQKIAAIQDAPAVIYDCPLLIETGDWKNVDQVLLVTVPQKTRIQRLMQRDGFTEEEALGRIGMQMADDEKIARADSVIVNDGTIDELRKQIEEWISLNIAPVH
ncbi:MAG: dephospho-CoA kinase [Eubacteriaceae bacterium]|jgi:dephospho-CoA kinase